MFYNWVKIAFKNFLADKFNFLINLFGLSIGLVGLVISLLHYSDELLYDKWLPNGDNIYVHENYSDKFSMTSAPPAFGPAAKAEIPEIEDYVYAESWSFETVLKSKYNAVYTENLIAVEDRFFDIMPFKFIVGNGNEVLQDSGMALEKKTALALFGNNDPIGEIVNMHGNEFIVRGIYELPQRTSIKPNLVIQSGIFKEDPNNWDRWNYYLFYKIKPNSDIGAIQDKLLSIFRNKFMEPRVDEGIITEEQFMEEFGNPKMLLTPFADMRLHSKNKMGLYGNSSSFVLLILMLGLSIIILFSSCINFINTTIANALRRAKEVSVRKVLGASKSSIIIQFLFETTIICVLSLLLSLVLVELLLPYVNDFLNKEMVFDNGLMLLFLVLVVFVVIILSGLLPAIYLSNYKPSEILKGSFLRSKKGIHLRNAILFVQFIISAFFLIGSLIVYQQVTYMSKKDLGFSGKQLLIINFKQFEGRVDGHQKYLKAKAIFEKLPEVKAVTTSLITPNGKNNFVTDVRYNEKFAQTNLMGVEYNFMKLADMTLLEGRNFSPDISTDTINTCIVNQKLIKRMQWDEALGKQVILGIDSIPFTVVGVVKDFHLDGFNQEIKPTTLIHYNVTDWMNTNISNIQLKVQSDDLPKFLETLEDIWKSDIEPGFPFEYEFMDKQFAKSYELFLKLQSIFFVLSFIVVLVALLGLYAVTSFIIKQRLKEVAIRKVLGAESNQIVYQLSKEFYWIVGISILCAMPIIYFVTQKWLELFVYRIDMPIMPYLIGFFALALLTLVVVSVRAYKATQIDMVKYLKYE